MIPFNKVFLTGNEFEYVNQAVMSSCLSGDGDFTKKCHAWLETHLKTKKALLTHSCTAALEMAAILIDLMPGDEVIMPSYTFVSTANAFVLRGGVPVFVDIREDTLNIDESLIEEAITEKTKAIVVVHYAGVACEMNTIMAIAKKYNLFVIEDAAQAINAKYHDLPLGSIGHLGTLSFHETKNVVSGEGGALLINDASLIERAEIIREKGTNRAQFSRHKVDKYHWLDIGSSYLPSELIAAFLLAQLEKSDFLIQERMKVWTYYNEKFVSMAKNIDIRLPNVPEHCKHNGHIYYLILKDKFTRDALIKELKNKNISAVFHYVPLHSSPAGIQYGRAMSDLSVTNAVADRLIRLPLWVGLSEDMQDQIIDTALAYRNNLVEME